MSKVETTLASQATKNPKETFRVIVRVKGDLDARQAQLTEMGFSIARRLRLISGFGATATGASLQESAQQDWIVSIEPDGEMRTMKDAVNDS